MVSLYKIFYTNNHLDLLNIFEESNLWIEKNKHKMIYQVEYVFIFFTKTNDSIFMLTMVDNNNLQMKIIIGV